MVIDGIQAASMQFLEGMNSEPSKADCQGASYHQSEIWSIEDAMYYCYSYVPGTHAYYG